MSVCGVNRHSTALAALNGREVLGSQLGVAWHVVQGAKEDTSNHITVFVGNIGDAIDEYTLFEAFAQYNCSDSRIVRGDDGRCLGYGFVTIRTQVRLIVHMSNQASIGLFSRLASALLLLMLLLLLHLLLLQ